MNLTIPSLSPKSRSRLRRMDPRTLDTSGLKSSINLPSIERPHMEMPHLEMPHVDLPHVDMPHLDLPRLDLPRLEFPSIEFVDHAGKSVGDAGRAVAGRASDAGRAMGGLLETAGGHLHDLRMSVAPPAKRASVAQRGMVALAIASIVASVTAAAAYFLHPVRGAARRAALRQRFRIGAREARTGVDTAIVAARGATERATEVVRIPVESAKEVVGGHNGHAETEAADAAATIEAADATAAATGAPEAEGTPKLVAAGSATESGALEPAVPAGATWVAASATSQGTNGSHAGSAKDNDAEAVGE